MEIKQLSDMPYADLIEMLRLAFKQAEKTVSANPKDQEAIDLSDFLKRRIRDLESGHDCHGHDAA